MYPILAIDYGEKNFGLAISDSKGIVASPLEVISITKNRGIQIIIEEIVEIAKENRAKTILVGKPQSFTDKQKKTEEKIEKFINLLRKATEIEILTWDESFSTTNAQNMLTSLGQNSKSSRRKIDKIAATVFLQEFLNSKNKKNESRKKRI
ncbi:MAG: Putative Holliday junction resolvase [candidate division WS6 bacterium 36_33]|uniref:Putative pre-16S rRNA nuclease n=1 Tax=candidate division WS6 bacterium 36_33 TaxID=1641388 RepID=A0A101H0R6_9BACT|nr:MAG: Putative Holliday junction resolvase [candidate division WS6 bacterium 36_33]